MPQYFEFHPNPQAPSIAVPPLSCDSQFHVFGPADQYPVRPGAAYEMPSATWQRARAMHHALGIERGVIVQSTAYGADHAVVLDALNSLNEGHAQRRYLACANAMVLLDASDEHLQDLHTAGVRGARLSRGSLGISFGEKEVALVFERVRALGWYVKVQPELNGLADQLAYFRHDEVPMMIDHIGRPDVSLGESDPKLQCTLDLLQRDNVWVMLSMGEKLSRIGEPWDDLQPIVRKVVAHAPDRCVWGSDWPHPVSTKPPPQDGALLDLLARCVPDEAQRERILVTNPARFFGF